MLAAHLSRINRPVRYAMPPQMDPELAQSIRNYLALTLRGANVPHLHHQAQGVLQPFYQQHPAAQQMFHGLLGEHDPAALLQYLDMLAEHGPTLGVHPDEAATAARIGIWGPDRIPGRPDVTPGPYQWLLGHLHHTARPLQGDLMGQNSPVRAFSPGAIEHGGESLYHAIGNAHAPELLHLLRSLTGHGYYNALSDRYAGHLRDQGRSLHTLRNPLAAVPLYDTIHGLLGEQQLRGTPLHVAAGNALNETSNIIHRTIIPHLYENQP